MFFIDKQYRGLGLSRLMLKAAIYFLKEKNVKIIEAYSTPLTKAGEKLPPAFSFTGPLRIFEDAEFTIIQRHSHSRPLARLG